MPRLRIEVERQALLIDIGDATFADAHSAVMCTARSRGAVYLPTDRLDELDDWISSALLSAVDQAEARRLEICTDVERLRAADPVAYYERLAASCSKPDEMRWVFAALSPEYRRHLLAVRQGGR